MTAVITQRDETAVATGNGYRYDRTVQIAGRIVRARIERHHYHSYSFAFVDMINDEKSWVWMDSLPVMDTVVDRAVRESSGSRLCG